ncbi:MAG: lytic transglycosylase domain-containing protein, partial [Bdellovibrionales bacterium]|nr:lytic transglycosylase domain-containing protein [Bdellovibrionales bacterium]
ESIAKPKPLLSTKSVFTPVDQKPFFDIPVTYNAQVRTWIRFFQGSGKSGYKKWLERSHRYLPHMQTILEKRSMPKDLAYIAMIESGFSAHAVSTADAVGYWQFIKSTANRYGLQTKWWIDERRDFNKSTQAACSYLSDLYKMFGSWYLTASAYNMGENRLKRLIEKYKTENYWILSKKHDFPAETRDYIPKMIAAMLIAKAPKLYGFNNIAPEPPHSYEYFFVPGGTDLYILADKLGVNRKDLQKLNPELVKGFVPGFVKNHKIRIPPGFTTKVSSLIRNKNI